MSFSAGELFSQSSYMDDLAGEKLGCIKPTPATRAGSDTKSISRQSKAAVYLEFSFFETGCFTYTKERCLHYYSPIAGGKIEGFMPFLGVLVRKETQTVLSKI